MNKKDVLVSDFGKDSFKLKFDDACGKLGFSKEDISFNHPIDTKACCKAVYKACATCTLSVADFR